MICKQQQVEGYPTVKAFDPTNDRPGVEVHVGREASAIVQYASGVIGPPSPPPPAKGERGGGGAGGESEECSSAALVGEWEHRAGVDGGGPLATALSE